MGLQLVIRVLVLTAFNTWKALEILSAASPGLTLSPQQGELLGNLCVWLPWGGGSRYREGEGAKEFRR